MNLNSDFKVPQMDVAKYQPYLTKSLYSGISAEATRTVTVKQVISNIAHNIMTVFHQLHTYCTEKTKAGDRKWFNNETIAARVDAKLAKLDANIQQISNRAEIANSQDFIAYKRDVALVKATIEETGRVLSVLLDAKIGTSSLSAKLVESGDEAQFALAAFKYTVTKDDIEANRGKKADTRTTFKAEDEVEVRADFQKEMDIGRTRAAYQKGKVDVVEQVNTALKDKIALLDTLLQCLVDAAAATGMDGMSRKDGKLLDSLSKETLTISNFSEVAGKVIKLLENEMVKKPIPKAIFTGEKMKVDKAFPELRTAYSTVMHQYNECQGLNSVRLPSN